MQPKIMTSEVVRTNELSGNSKVGWTFANTRDSGNPPSRAKAQVIRLLVVMIVMVAKRMQIKGKLQRVSERSAARARESGSTGAV